MLQFIDAKYTYDTKLPTDIEPKVETYEEAYTTNKYGDYILCTGDEYFIVPRDCALPDCYDDTKYNKDKQLNFSKYEIGETIKIMWKDVTNLDKENQKVISKQVCSQMYTEGIFLENHKHFLIIQNPETMRLSPTPFKNHPEKRPMYYVIPKCAVTNLIS